MEHYQDLKNLLGEVDSDFSKIQLQLVRKFAFAFGVQVGCYEEFHRILREIFGDRVAASFAKEYDTKTYPGCSLMQRKGVVLQNAEIEGRRRIADFVMTRISKEFKILKKNMKFEIGKVNYDEEDKKVTFSDPVTGLSCETFIARLDIVSTLKRTRPNIIFSFNFPFVSGDDEAYVMRGKLKLLMNPVVCGGVLPKEENGQEEMIDRVDDDDRERERFPKRNSKLETKKKSSSKTQQHLSKAKKKGKKEQKTIKKNK